MQATTAPVSVYRLRFIDLARAVAILLMLEGHFVDVTLAPEWRIPGNPIHEVWLHARGLAAPMFFTVTGLIFAYLLHGSRESGFLRVKRVRRGLKRAGELLFWGYLLQVDVSLLPDYLHGHSDDWLVAFHVLQCIAVGLLIMIFVFGIGRRASPVWQVAIHLAGGFGLFLLSILLANHPGYLPAGAPEWLQNPLKGPRSSFPVAPWLGFTLYGAAIGVILRSQGTQAPSKSTALILLGVGLLLKVAGWSFDRALGETLLDLTGGTGTERLLPHAFHGRIGEILLALAFLMWLEIRFQPRVSWLLTVGRNTFPIYVSHVIVLYGGIFGIGLNDWLRKSLNPWQAAIGAVLFCGTFALGAQFVEPLLLRWREWRDNGAAKP